MVPIDWSGLLTDTAMTTDELCERCGVSRPTMQDHIDEAVKSGLLEKRSHPETGICYISLRRNEK